jgi:P pilus assembly chaperone PapD
MTPDIRRAAATLFVLAAACIGLCQRPGDLVIAPTRIVLDDKNRVNEINLVNTGAQSVRYRITIVDMEMSEDGAMKRIQSSDTSAAGILRLSPREVLLQPGVSQRIKIAALFPEGAQDRELRSHLSFEQILPPREGNPSPDGPGSGLSIRLNVRSVVTIPVICRHGRLFAETSISSASIENDQTGSSVRFALTRTGSRSVRGDVTVLFEPTDGGAKVLLGRIVGLPVYCPNADRIVTLRLARDVRSLGKGSVIVSFAEPDKSRGAATARSVIRL